jgi:hypothetical protein
VSVGDGDGCLRRGLQIRLASRASLHESSAIMVWVRLRFYIDPVTGGPHIHDHGVDEAEVEEVLANPGEDRSGSEGSRIATGATEAGRIVRVVYSPDPEPDSVFVITAYELHGKPLKAYRRRQRRKRR